jgi:hypothetical protein
MATIKGILMPVDQFAPISVVEFDQSDYTQITKLIGGTFGVTDTLRPDASVWYHDEGKILGLPVNRRASLFLWVHRTEFRGYDALMGDVLILGPADDEGNTTSVPDELVELLFNTKEYRYLVQTSGDDSWNGNGVTYDNWVDAYNGGLSLAERWTLVEHVKVVAA